MCGSGGSAARSAACRTSPVTDARPTKVSPSGISISCSAATSSSLVPTHVRSLKLFVEGSSSKMEPPSVFESSTARVTIVVST